MFRSEYLSPRLRFSWSVLLRKKKPKTSSVNSCLLLVARTEDVKRLLSSLSVKRAVYLLEVLISKVCVHLRGRDIGMSEKFLD